MFLSYKLHYTHNWGVQWYAFSLIFAPKYRLCVLLITALARWSKVYPQSILKQKISKQKLHLKKITAYFMDSFHSKSYLDESTREGISHSTIQFEVFRPTHYRDDKVWSLWFHDMPVFLHQLHQIVYRVFVCHSDVLEI